MAATGPAAPLAVLVTVSVAGGVLLVLARVRATVTSGTWRIRRNAGLPR